MTRALKPLLVAAFLGVGLFLSSCSSSPSDEELRMLEDLKAQATQLEGKVSELQRDKAGLEKQIADKNAKLQQCQSDQEAVKKALGK
ncbi:MAG TPA: hypothetical protein VGR15_07500 [Bacteroidota bacterium]|jgi:septal ring factor EnvC (AmiA/AmiB activator)|nr:hypothetical protein [Bacteroidota bacterium]